MPTMMDVREIYWIMKYIYRCDKCKNQYPVFWVSDSDWKMSGFSKSKSICKKCFEERCSKRGFAPRYYSLDEYLDTRIANDYTQELEDIEQVRIISERCLRYIWDLPDEGEATTQLNNELKEYKMTPGDLRRSFLERIEKKAKK